MTNIDVRIAANQANVRLWQIAERFKGGMTDFSFSRKLRHELPEAEKQDIYKIIDDISRGTKYAG